MKPESTPSKQPRTPEEVLAAVKDSQDSVASIREILVKSDAVSATDMALYLKDEKKWSAQQILELLQCLGDNKIIFEAMLIIGFERTEIIKLIVAKATKGITEKDMRDEIREGIMDLLEPSKQLEDL
jgi:hypothetical protein